MLKQHHLSAGKAKNTSLRSPHCVSRKWVWVIFETNEILELGRVECFRKSWNTPRTQWPLMLSSILCFEKLLTLIFSTWTWLFPTCMGKLFILNVCHFLSAVAFCDLVDSLASSVLWRTLPQHLTHQPNSHWCWRRPPPWAPCLIYLCHPHPGLQQGIWSR